MQDKIIQIIPAPADMWSVHRGTDQGEEYEGWCRIVCMALVEDPESGYRCVRPMTMTEGDGMVDFIDESKYSDFNGIAYATVEEAHRRGMIYDVCLEEGPTHE